MPYVTTLTEDDLDFGKRLTERLKAERFPFRGVFWLYDDETDDWQLVVATDLVEKEGPRKTYLRLAKVTSSVAGSDFQLMRISAINPRGPLYRALSSTFGKTASVLGARLRQTVVNGILIPEAYLYEIH